MSVSVVIPAKNEVLTIGRVVSSALGSHLIKEVLVVDNGSTDATGIEARSAGARVILEPQEGMGKAIIRGTLAAENDLIVKVDGDISNPTTYLFDRLAQGLDEADFAKGYYYSSYDEFPVANLVAWPALDLLYPKIRRVRMPLCGMYAFNRTVLNVKGLPPGWAFDIALLIEFLRGPFRITEVDIGLLNDRQKVASEYRGMATELWHYFLTQSSTTKLPS